MIYETNLDQKLTGAAREALKEMVEDYREQLLVLAAENAARLTGEAREVSVHDLLRALQNLDSSKLVSRRSLLSKVLSAYALTGFFLGVVGLGWFAFRDVFVSLDPKRQIPLILSFAGFTFACLSIFIAKFYEKRNFSRLLRPAYSASLEGDSPSAIFGAFMYRWNQIELALRDVVGKRVGESVADGPLSSLISHLRSEELLDQHDVDSLRRMLDLRNAVVHKGHQLTEPDLRSYFHDAQRILDKLRSAEMSN